MYAVPGASRARKTVQHTTKKNGNAHVIECLKCKVRCYSEEKIIPHKFEDATHSSAATPKALLGEAVCTSADVTSQTTLGVICQCHLCKIYFWNTAMSVAGDDLNLGTY